MTTALYAEFETVAGLKEALDHALKSDIEVFDAYTPFPIDGLGEKISGDGDTRRLRLFMLVGGLGAAALAYGIEFYSAVIDYPFNAGARPANSWPTFVLFPFEFGILSAAITGLITLFVLAGLPRLHHPHFEVVGIERASADRFFLALACPETKAKRQRLEKKLAGLGALRTSEVPQ